MEFTVSSRAQPPDALITIGGDVDVFGAAEIGYRIDAALRLGCRGFWLDAERVSFLDAAACSQLARSVVRMGDHSATFDLVSASDHFLRGCDIAGLRVFEGRTLTLRTPEA